MFAVVDFGTAWVACGPRWKIGETKNDANFNVAEIGAVNMGEIGAVRKRSR